MRSIRFHYGKYWNWKNKATKKSQRNSIYQMYVAIVCLSSNVCLLLFLRKKDLPIENEKIFRWKIVSLVWKCHLPMFKENFFLAQTKKTETIRKLKLFIDEESLSSLVFRSFFMCCAVFLSHLISLGFNSAIQIFDDKSHRVQSYAMINVSSVVCVNKWYG